LKGIVLPEVRLGADALVGYAPTILARTPGFFYQERFLWAKEDFYGRLSPD
jgi:hypothetical protein